MFFSFHFCCFCRFHSVIGSDCKCMNVFYDGSCCIIAMHKMKWSKCWWTNDRTRHTTTISKMQQENEKKKKLFQSQFCWSSSFTICLLAVFYFIQSSFKCALARALNSMSMHRKFVFDSKRTTEHVITGVFHICRYTHTIVNHRFVFALALSSVNFSFSFYFCSSLHSLRCYCKRHHPYVQIISRLENK